MNNVCFIGNSHLGAIRLGNDIFSSEMPSDFTTSFYGAPNDRLGTLYKKEDFLVSNDLEVIKYFNITAGSNRLNVFNYKTFVVHGFMGINPHLKNQSKRRFFSSAAYNCAFVGQFMNPTSSCVIHLIKLIKSINPSVDIYVTPRPFDLYTGVFDADGIYLEEIYQEFSKFFQNLGANFISQPDVTLGGPFGTADIYAKDGCHLLGDIAADGMHMNQLYGVEYLRSVFSLLNKKF